MKYIQKNLKNEPISLKEKRSTPGANFDSCSKEDIRIALLAEQGKICAYCTFNNTNLRYFRNLSFASINFYHVIWFNYA